MLNSALSLPDIPVASQTCTFADTGDGGIKCVECGRLLPRWEGKHPIAVCRGKQPEPPKPVMGPGGYLKSMLKWIGIVAKPNCACNSRARHMDAMGAAWCRQNIETILGWLREEAEQRKLPFPEASARGLVLLAISRSEKAAKRMARRTPDPT